MKRAFNYILTFGLLVLLLGCGGGSGTMPAPTVYSGDDKCTLHPGGAHDFRVEITINPRHEIVGSKVTYLPTNEIAENIASGYTVKYIDPQGVEREFIRLWLTGLPGNSTHNICKIQSNSVDPGLELMPDGSYKAQMTGDEFYGTDPNNPTGSHWSDWTLTIRQK